MCVFTDPNQHLRLAKNSLPEEKRGRLNFINAPYWLNITTIYQVWGLSVTLMTIFFEYRLSAFGLFNELLIPNQGKVKGKSRSQCDPLLKGSDDPSTKIVSSCLSSSCSINFAIADFHGLLLNLSLQFLYFLLIRLAKVN
jgi:hypothetical protein